MPKFTPIKDSYRYVVFIVVFMVSILFCYQIFPRLISMSINIAVNFSELEGESGSFYVSMRLILEIIFMGPVLSVIYYFLMKYLISGIDEDAGKNKYYIYLIEAGVVIFICISCMGHIVHMLFDRASWIYYTNNDEEMDTSELYSLIYYSDEWLGHALIHIAIFGFISMALIAEFIGKAHRKMNWDELIYTTAASFGLGIVYFTTFEGQAAFLMFILWSILVSIALIITLIKRINPLHRPILFALFLNYIIVIILFIVWISLFGIKPYYPFLDQPSELI